MPAQDQSSEEPDKDAADRTRAHKFYAEAERLHESSDYAGAISLYDAAVALYRDLAGHTEENQNDLARALGSRGHTKSQIGNLLGAIADYDAAIKLREAICAALGASSPVPMRNSLAIVLQNRGNAKAQSSNLSEAIADYDAAIKLLEAIREVLGAAWPVPMRENLAAVLQNRGNAKATFGDLVGVVADFDAAIKLREEIRETLGAAWPMPMRNSLAGVLQNRGNAKATFLGDVVGAIADLDAAIGLREMIREALGAAWPMPMRNDLAQSLHTRGITKLDSDDLVGAIADYDAAIELRESIRETLCAAWPVPLRNDLALVYMNRGSVRKEIDDQRGALDDHQRAHHMLSPLVTRRNGAYFPALDTYLGNASILIDLLVQTSDADAATDIADESLSVARDLEAGGINSFRARREYAFGLALEAYGTAGMVGALPEIISENLEPDVPGSACDSAQMHATAAAAIQHALAKLGDHDSDKARATRGALRTTARRLATLRALYFSGTAHGTGLNAALALARGDVATAEEIYSVYIERHRADPGGHVARARFYEGQRDNDGAMDDYTVAAQLIAARVDPGEPQDVERVATIAEAMLRLHLSASAETFAGTTAIDPRFQAEFNGRRDWLVDELPRAVLGKLDGSDRRRAAAWREALSPALKRVWQTVAEPLRQTLLKKSIETIKRDKDTEWQQRLRRVADGLPMPWQDFVRTIVDAHEEVAAARGTMAAAEDDDDAALEAQVADAMAARVRGYTLRIADGELIAAERAVAASLGTLWEQALTGPERRYLSCAFHCAQDPAMASFAPLPLGCAVEHALLDRLVAPLRDSGAALPPPVGDDYLGHLLHGHLTNNKALTLGPLIGLYGRALGQATGQPSPWPGYRRLGQRLAGAAELPALRLDDAGIRKRRLDALNCLVALRNRVAHPKPEAGAGLPSGPEFAAAWHAIVDDPVDAFFRYFSAAFPANPTPT